MHYFLVYYVNHILETRRKIKLGLNLSHEASVALTTESGEIIYAIEEERLSRNKGDNNFPLKAMLSLTKLDLKEPITEVIIGNSNFADPRDAARFAMTVDEKAKFNGSDEGLINYWTPGFPIPDRYSSENPKHLIQESISKVLNTCLNNGNGSLSRATEQFTWVKHHDGHLGCGLGMVSESPTLILSIDGEGDWESGAVALSVAKKISQRKTIATHLDSLGHLYSQVTSAYGFKPSRHEGKITGLAAYGKYSAATEVLLQAVTIDSGKISLNYIKNNDLAKLVSKLKSLHLTKQSFTSMEDIVNAARAQTSVWPDLAFAIQHVLEKSVLEIVDYWRTRFNVKQVALSGGVFANVKLNQKISELPGLESVSIFPHMGDGGLSLGGVWHQLSVKGNLSKGQLFQNMYLSEEYFKNDVIEDTIGVCFQELTHTKLLDQVTQDLQNGLVIGLHVGGVEFGPRALGNRSILFDAARPKIGQLLNARLKRTEFMPFAPVVLERYFKEYFHHKGQSFEAFEYMTITCDVREEVRSLIPAVTHIDGTARPQVIPENSKSMIKNILENYFKSTGIPVLVNTSLNMHEEPINGHLSDSIKCLRLKCIDKLVVENGIYSIE